MKSTCAQQQTTQRLVAKLTRDMTQMKLIATKAYNAFELARQQKGPFKRVISDLKTQRRQLATVTSHLNSALAATPIFSLIERLVLQFQRIQAEKLATIFGWIGSELLDHYSDITSSTSNSYIDIDSNNFTSSESGSSISRMQFSQTVEIANNVAHYNFVHFVASVNETNRLVVAAINRTLKDTKVKPEMRATIDGRLQTLIKTATEGRVELTQSYYSEVEKFIESGRELNLLQKLQLEKFRDAYHYAVHFLRAYRLMLRQLFAISGG